jgi:hypothetical protein
VRSPAHARGVAAVVRMRSCVNSAGARDPYAGHREWGLRTHPEPPAPAPVVARHEMPHQRVLRFNSETEMTPNA